MLREKKMVNFPKNDLLVSAGVVCCMRNVPTFYAIFNKAIPLKTSRIAAIFNVVVEVAHSHILLVLCTALR